MAKDLNEKQRTFCQLVAKGEAPYKACIEAGYSEKYAKNFSGKLLEKYGKEIAELKETVKEVIKEEFKYTVKESFDYLCNIQNMAMNSLDKNGNPNLTALIKAEELKGKMFGVYQADNEQKTNNFEISINRKPVDVNKD
jgi:hypothetical protein